MSELPSSNEQNLFLVTTVSTQAGGFVGRLYLTAEHARDSIQGNEFVESVLIRDSVETPAPRIVSAAFDLMNEAPLVAHVERPATVNDCAACSWLAKVQEWYARSGLAEKAPASQRPTSFGDCDECIGGCEKCMPSVKTGCSE